MTFGYFLFEISNILGNIQDVFLFFWDSRWNLNYILSIWAGSVFLLIWFWMQKIIFDLIVPILKKIWLLKSLRYNTYKQCMKLAYSKEAILQVLIKSKWEIVFSSFHFNILNIDDDNIVGLILNRLIIFVFVLIQMMKWVVLIQYMVFELS